MTWALLGVLIVTLTITLFWVFRLTVTVSKTSSNALASLISFDQRAQVERSESRQQVQALVDRIMSQDWEAVRMHESADETPDGGFFAPQEQEDTEITLERPGWGSMSTAQERADQLDAMQSLAEEDDLDRYEEERSQIR